jgi:uncharacterized protein YegL
MSQYILLLTTLTCLLGADMFIMSVYAQQKIHNGIADPQVVYEAQTVDRKKLCKIEGPPLDLMFVIDASGSVREEFVQQLSVVKTVLNNLAVGPNSVRVSLIQYATSVYTRFKFNTYTNRADMLDQIDHLGTAGSLTNTGAALTQALKEWSEESGMRADGLKVDRVLFLLSDGRSRDYPLDVQAAKNLREQKRVKLYAFGLGEFIDWAVLREVVTGSHFDGYNQVVNSGNLTNGLDWFTPYKGTEVCEEVPVCVPGSSRPIDILFIIDTSTSVNNDFEESLSFVRRTLNNVNVDPTAARIALITYSSNAHIAFTFNNPRAQNNTGVLGLLNEVQPYEGVTNTVDALKVAAQLFENAPQRSGDVKKLVIIITDAYSSADPAVYARRLVELKKVDIFAVALSPGDAPVNNDGLNDLVVSRSERVFPVSNRVFIAHVNLMSFESALLNYTDKSCPGLNVTSGDTPKTVTLKPVEAVCSSTGMRVVIRTKSNFDGLLYALGYDAEAGCTLIGSNKTETRMVIPVGTCGMQTIAAGGSYTYKVTLGIRYHPAVDTVNDESVTVDCPVQGGTPQTLPVDNTIGKSTDSFQMSKVKCNYRVSPMTGQSCQLLDAEVGVSVNHEWQCDGLTNDQFIFVHDCVADTDGGDAQPLALLTNQGCEVDKYIMTTPVYDVRRDHANDKVSVQTYMFKFPSETIVRFRCLVSVCNLNQRGDCEYAFVSNRT